MDSQAVLPSSWAQRPGASSTTAPVGTPVGRRELARALEFAAAGSDPEALAFAIDQASRAGVSPGMIARAEKRKLALEEEASGARSKRARDDAEGALEWAVGAQSVDMLEAAIRQAEDMGVSGEVVEHARAKQVEWLADTLDAEAQQQALAAVRSARQQMDMPGMMLALKRCDEVAANPELVREEALGPLAQRQGMAACILAFAKLGSSIEVLDYVIEWARTEGVSMDELVAACQRRRDLEDAEERHETVAEAASALAAAWNATDQKALASSIDRAKRAGVGAHMVAMAEKRLLSLRERSRQGTGPAAAPMAPATAPATPALAAPHAPPAPAAAPSADVVAARFLAPIAVAPETPAPRPAALSAAGWRPAAAAPTSPEVDPRRKQLCKEAATALKTAMVRSNAAALEAAIEQADVAGVSRELVAPARRKLSRLLQKPPGA